MFSFLDLLFPPRDDERLVRTLSLSEFLAHLSPTRVEETAPHTTALLSFRVPVVRAAVHEAKYHGDSTACAYLGAALADYLSEGDQAYRTKTRIVPLPLGKARLRERGFNQVARCIESAALPHPIDPILVRVRDTVSQISLPRLARKENMRGAFGAAHPADPAVTYVLVDDVITTGATLQAAIDALRAAGAVNVIPIALAH